MNKSSRFMRALSGVIACLFCIGMLVSAASIDIGGAKVMMAAKYESRQGISRERSSAQISLDPLFSSKRRVPNGPDPIHNRRAGKSGRNPGRV